MTTEELERENSIENFDFSAGERRESDIENEAGKEKIVRELAKIDSVRKLVAEKYPPYGVLRDFIDHLASTEKVFTLAGIKKFGGDEIMGIFIDSELSVMSDDTQIDKSVFIYIKKEFIKTLNDIGKVTSELRSKYGNNEAYEKFIQYLEDNLTMLLEVSRKSEESNFDVNKEKEGAIHDIIKKIAEDDKAEMEELESIYEEFKKELDKIGD
ncbi:MAG TPA: hypothetical protein DDY52_03870 [Candidatus Moranbacteria bacterium]|nr:MAG: hypothetical protein UR51_C0008G0075 [Candidatus Moranbacteria bacterium GW2011_GWF1_34_10]HBI17252.1 hypothetical protein [Candidatus Moranbacteria bacterium]